MFTDLISYIEESIESGNFIFKLSELHSMYVSQLEELGLEKSIHKTRLKLQILDHFLFRRWMVAGPEQARILTEFESQFLESEEHNSQQHEQGHSTQQLFKKQVNSLAEVISSMGNPFLDDCPELLILDTRNCASDAVVSTV